MAALTSRGPLTVRAAEREFYCERIVADDYSLLLLNREAVVAIIHWDQLPGAWQLPNEDHRLDIKQVVIEAEPGHSLSVAGIGSELGSSLRFGCLTNKAGPGLVDPGTGARLAHYTIEGWNHEGRLLKQLTIQSQPLPRISRAPRGRTSVLAEAAHSSEGLTTSARAEMMRP